MLSFRYTTPLYLHDCRTGAYFHAPPVIHNETLVINSKLHTTILWNSSSLKEQCSTREDPDNKGNRTINLVTQHSMRKVNSVTVVRIVVVGRLALCGSLAVETGYERRYITLFI